MAKKAVSKPKSTPKPSERSSVRVEKIKNGYLVTKDMTDKKGNWVEPEKFYSKEDPLKGI